MTEMTDEWKFIEYNSISKNFLKCLINIKT